MFKFILIANSSIWTSSVPYTVKPTYGRQTFMPCYPLTWQSSGNSLTKLLTAPQKHLCQHSQTRVFRVEQRNLSTYGLWQPPPTLVIVLGLFITDDAIYISWGWQFGMSFSCFVWVCLHLLCLVQFDIVFVTRLRPCCALCTCWLAKPP